MFLFPLSLAVLLLLAALPASPAHAQTVITVSPNIAEPGVDGLCSLREAIQAANTNAAVDVCPAGSSSGTDTVVVPAGTYTLSIPGANEDLNATGDLDVAGDLTINGAGANTTIIDGGGIDRVLHIGEFVTSSVTVSDVTITGGGNVAFSGGILVGLPATLTLNRSAVSGNTVTIGGEAGGIGAVGYVTLNSSTVSGNTAPGFANVSPTAGGIYAYSGSLTLNNSTVSGNVAKYGGGIATSNAGPPVTLSNSTVSGNSASSGTGGGLYLGSNNVSGMLSLKNTIVAGNSGEDCTSGYVSISLTSLSLGYNVNSDGTCLPPSVALSSDLVGTLSSPLNAQLAPLGPYGGPTETHALCTGLGAPHSSCGAVPSPAIDHVAVSYCTDTAATPITGDQRGVPRPQDGDGNGSFLCDTGAYEVGAALTPTSSTGEYCISGASTGAGWDWRVVYVTSGGTKEFMGTVAPGSVPFPFQASDIADSWSQNISGSGNPGLSASHAASSNCFQVLLNTTVTGAIAKFAYFVYVNSCLITNNPSGCSFNPTVTYVAAVGGTVALSVTEAGSPWRSLPLAAGAAATVAALAAGALYARRRFSP